MGAGNQAETSEITGQPGRAGCSRRAADPTPPGDPGGTPSRARALPSAPETLVGVLFLLLSAFSALFPLLGPFWDNFDLILEPFGLQKPFIFIERVIKFKLFVIFSSDAAWEHENNPKKLQIAHPSPPKGIPEEPGSAHERPGTGEPQELPKTTPGALGGHPWASKKCPGVV